MLCSQAEVVTGKTLREALELKSLYPDAVVVAGGTDVMVFMEGGKLNPARFLNIWGCKGLSGISEKDGVVRIGAGTTWTEVGNCALLPDALRDCAKTVGAVQIQNRGTVGGNIVNASPAGDSLPLWLVLDAVMVVASVAGERRIPADSFFLGYRKVDLKADELLVAVEVPAVQSKVIYRKTGTRLAQAISKVILGARIAPGEFRVALGAVAPVPLRLKALEDALVAGERDRGVLKTLVESGIAPITDIRSTEAYRRRVAVNLVMRALE